MNEQNPGPEAKPAHEVMDGAFGTFPDYMVLVGDVFRFSYKAITPAMARFRRNSDLLVAINHTIEVMENSDIPDEEKATIVELLEQEKDVISYSIISRSSVIAI